LNVIHWHGDRDSLADQVAKAATWLFELRADLVGTLATRCDGIHAIGSSPACSSIRPDTRA
jgi:hypothetical protein